MLGKIVAVVLIVSVAVPYLIQNNCDGEKEWNTYTGNLAGVYVDAETCCHCDTRIKFYNQSWIYTYDCDESLVDLLEINETYTIHTEPFPEGYAVTGELGEPTCFWVEVIDYIEDAEGNVIYGSDWWLW